jgi:hypothetical protein
MMQARIRSSGSGSGELLSINPYNEPVVGAPNPSGPNRPPPRVMREARNAGVSDAPIRPERLCELFTLPTVGCARLVG